MTMKNEKTKKQIDSAAGNDFKPLDLNQQIAILISGLGLSGIMINAYIAETFLATKEAMDRLGANFSVRDAQEINAVLIAKYPKKC